MNDYLNDDNPMSFQLIIQVMVCIEDFYEFSKCVICYHYLSSDSYPVWTAENQSISSGRRVDVSGIKALGYPFVNHANK